MRRQARCRRSKIQSEDIIACKQFWEGLSSEAKLNILRFDDVALVQRIFEVQRRLYEADVRCYALGLRGQDAVRSRLGMDQFAMEASGDSMSPTLFFARPSFVNKRGFMAYLESELRQGFLTGQQTSRKEWPSIFDSKASSWADFLRQVLRLVESAIYEAYQEHAIAAAATSSAAPIQLDSLGLDLFGEGELDIHATSKISKSKKRKERKKRELGGTFEGKTVEEDRIFEEEESLVSVPSRAVVDGASSIDVDDVVSVSTIDTATAKARPMRPIIEGETAWLQVDWTAADTPFETTQADRKSCEADVELQVDWTGDADRPGAATWMAWVGNGLNGVRAEWYWVDHTRPRLTPATIRAHTKNTFLEISDAGRGAPQRPRSTPPVLRR